MKAAAGLSIPLGQRARAVWLERLKGPARLAAAVGLAGPTAALRRKLRGRAVTLVLYHDPPPAILDWHLTWFRQQGYQFISLRAFVEAAQRRDLAALPPQSLVVTLDDGWRGNADLLPVLRRHGCPATIFVCVGLVGTRRTIWDHVIPTDPPWLNAALKAMPNAQRVEVMRSVLGVHPLDNRPARTMLSHEEMAAMGEWVDFQSHGLFHPLLPRCTDEELRQELADSRRRLEEITGRSVCAFAYPYGQAGPRERRAAAEAGYKLGRTAGDDALASVDDDLFSVPCVALGDLDSIAAVRLRLAWAELRTLAARRHVVREANEAGA